MADTVLLTGLGGIAGAVMASQSDASDKLTFQDVEIMATGFSLLSLVIFVAVIVLIILFFVMVYKMFPDYKALHVLFTMIFGFFWLIPAMLYYLFIKKGYHMTGIRIVKRL